jgi:heptosyltransferase-2
MATPNRSMNPQTNETNPAAPLSGLVASGSVSRLAIRAPNPLGDAVMALPAMAAVRAGLREAKITVVAGAAVASIFEEETAAAPDDVIVVRDRARERDLLTAGKFDAVLLLSNSFRTAWVAYRAGIVNRWGFSAHLRKPLLTRAVPRPKVRLHQSAYYGALAAALGFEVPEALPRIQVRAESRRRADALLLKNGVAADAILVGFAPGAAYGHAKRWPPARVAQVISRVSRERGAIAVLVGADGDRAAGREIESALPADVTAANLIGRTDVRQLAGVLARCVVFVSNDSGGMHLAAAVGAHVVAIFGPTDERVTSPLGDHDVLAHQVFCRPCMLRDCPIDHRCMTRIGADRVFDAVSARLAAASFPRLDAASS